MDPPLVLAVDDDPMVRVIVERTLAQAGMAVALADSLAAARAAFGAAPPRLVLCDVELGDGSGLAFCEAVVGETGRAIPVVLMSGRGEEADILAGFDAGACDYLLKPIHPSELVAKVRMHLRQAPGGAGNGPVAPVREVWNGRVQLHAPLGVGGMGTVYRGTDRRLGRAVAVKILRSDLASDAQFTLRFLREARVLSRLALPGVPRVHDVGRAGGTYYYVMDLLEGETLLQRVERQGVLAAPELARVGRELARILAALEEHELLHRDIKPANVLLTAGGAVGLVDFGLARGLRDTRLTRNSQIAGTVGYIAPEAILDDAAPDMRGDLYALGRTLVFAATRSEPGVGTPAALLVAANQPAARLHERLGPAAAGLCDLIAALTEPDPGRRPASAADALARFDALAVRHGDP